MKVESAMFSPFTLRTFVLYALDDDGDVIGTFTGGDDVIIDSCPDASGVKSRGDLVLQSRPDENRRDVHVTWSPGDGWTGSVTFRSI